MNPQSDKQVDIRSQVNHYALEEGYVAYEQEVLEEVIETELTKAKREAVEEFAEELKEVLPDFVAVNPPVTTTGSFFLNHTAIDSLLKQYNDEE